MWSHQRGRRSPDRQDESGETLIEVLLTVILMGIVVVAVLTSLFVLVRTAGLNKERTRVSVGVQAVTERLKQPVDDVPGDPVGAMAYKPCGSVAHYQGLVDDFFSADADSGVQNFVVEVKSVEYAQGTFTELAAPNDGKYSFTPPTATGNISGNFGTGCTAHPDVNSTDRDGGTQRIVVEVRSAPGTSFESSDEVTLIKRDARCPVDSLDNQNPDAGPC